MNLNAYLTKALSIGIEAHQGQRDRQKMAYMTHPIRVGQRLLNRFGKGGAVTDDILAAAYLHDVVEDTPLGFQDLLDLGMSETTVDLVRMLTHEKGEPYEDYIDRIRSGPKAAIWIKLCDLEDNTAAWRGGASKKHIEAQFRLGTLVLWENE